MHVYKPAKYYEFLAINNAIILSGSISLTFIAVANKPRTYYEALCSLYLSE